MLKKRINKIKTKQKQRQKQMQIVNVNIHKPTRRPREGPPQRNVQQLPTPQYIYTSQTDSLVPQMFNKQGQQESMPTLSEQINKSLEEKLNKIASQYNISMTKPTQPTQQEVRQTRTETYKPNKQKMIKEYTINKPNKTTETKKPITYTNVFNDPMTNISPPIDIFTSPTNYLKPNMPPNYYYGISPIKPNIVSQPRPNIYKSEPETLETIIKKPRTNIKTEKINDSSPAYNPIEKQTKNSNDLNMFVKENTVPFIPNEPILVKSEPVNIYNTVAKSRSTTSGYGSDRFEQKPGYSVKQGSGYGSGYESGYKSESGMTAEQISKMKQDRIKAYLPNKPEEKIPSLIESIKPFDKPVQEKVVENNDQKVEELNQRLFKLVAENKQIQEDLAKQEAKKYKAHHGTKMSYNKKIDEYKANIKKNNLDIYVLTQQINSIENKNI